MYGSIEAKETLTALKRVPSAFGAYTGGALCPDTWGLRENPLASKGNFQLFAPGEHIRAQKAAQRNVVHNKNEIGEREGERLKPGG